MSKKLGKAAFTKKAKAFIEDFQILLEKHGVVDSENYRDELTLYFDSGYTFALKIDSISAFDAWAEDKDYLGPLNVDYSLVERRETNPRKKKK